MQRLADFLDGIARATASIVRWLALIMVLVQFAIVVGRYVFGVNSIAAQESVLYMHATLFMLGAAYTLTSGNHQSTREGAETKALQPAGPLPAHQNKYAQNPQSNWPLHASPQ